MEGCCRAGNDREEIVVTQGMSSESGRLAARSSANIASHLAVLAELDQLFRDHGVTYWLFGGWAVDFHAGRVTREHDDIDIAIWSDDRAQLATLLHERAWIHRPDAGEDGYTRYERNEVRLEVAFLARDERGDVYTPLQDGRGEWPRDSFGDDIAHLHGVHARVVSSKSLIADKSIVRSDSATAAKDRADIATLLQLTNRSASPLLTKGDMR